MEIGVERISQQPPTNPKTILKQTIIKSKPHIEVRIISNTPL